MTKPEVKEVVLPHVYTVSCGGGGAATVSGWGGKIRTVRLYITLSTKWARFSRCIEAVGGTYGHMATSDKTRVVDVPYGPDSLRLLEDIVEHLPVHSSAELFFCGTGRAVSITVIPDETFQETLLCYSKYLSDKVKAGSLYGTPQEAQAKIDRDAEESTRRHRKEMQQQARRDALVARFTELGFEARADSFGVFFLDEAAERLLSILDEMEH